MKTLNLSESIRLAEKYGIKFAPHAIAKDEKGLAKACKRLGFPVALKVVSGTISHKTEAGGVVTGIRSNKEALSAYRRLWKLKGFEGLLVQKMVKGTEVIIGGKRDVQFGPTLLVGLGGIFVEVFQDYSIGICPISTSQTRKMLQELKSYPILKGYRGRKGVNLHKLEEAILKVSRMMIKETTIQELDLNPIIANEKEVIAVDARVVVDGK